MRLYRQWIVNRLSDLNDRGVLILNLKNKTMENQFDPGSCCDGDSGCCGGVTGCC